jgi:hypothetical protein
MFQFVQVTLNELNGIGKSGKPGHARAMGLLGDNRERGVVYSNGATDAT